jgi:hypothetical protein
MQEINKKLEEWHQRLNGSNDPVERNTVLKIILELNKQRTSIRDNLSSEFFKLL